jgi:hypothetical protein
MALTGIDIRKALIAAGLRPSDYDEQGIYNYIAENIDEDGLFDIRPIAAIYKVR